MDVVLILLSMESGLTPGGRRPEGILATVMSPLVPSS